MNKSKNKYYYNKAYYNYTSEAYDYDTHITSREKTAIRKRIFKNKKIKYIKSEKNIKWLSFKFIFTLSILFVFATSVLILQGKIIHAQININNLNKELKTVRQDNNYLKTELSKILDLNEIESLAISEIGMQYPTSSQIIYINVPKESYTLKNEDVQNTKFNFLSKFYDIFNFKK